MVGISVLAGETGEIVTKWVPLDPFITLGLAATAFAALGWLIGPSIGNGLFYMFNRRWKVQMKLVRRIPAVYIDKTLTMAQKENQFFARIKKNRVDPTNSSPTRNPGASYPPSTGPLLG
jgi:mitochondrial import inner membrane translocase subunit TIM23